MKSAQFAIIAVPLLLTGCILPIPTSHVAAPSIHGRVVHANTGAPVDMAGVVVENFKEASVLTSRDGSFKTDQITRSRPFWIWWPFSGDSVEEVTVRVVRPGFGKAKQKVQWHPKSESEVYLSQPITLKSKSGDDAARDLLQQAVH